MIDPVLERKLADMKELMASWSKFSEFFIMGAKGEDLNPDKESQFLELKSRIAMLHDTFLESIEHGQKIAQDMLDIVQRSITLNHLSRLSVAEIKKMRLEWHDAYLLLSETIALLEEEKERLAEVKQIEYAFNQFKKNLAVQIHNIVTSVWLKVVGGAIAVLFIIWGIPNFGIYDYTELHNYKTTQKPYDALARIYRNTLNHDFPYFGLKELERSDTLPLDVEHGDKNTPQMKQFNNKNNLKQNLLPSKFGNNAVITIINKCEEHTVEPYTVKSTRRRGQKNPLMLFLFRMKDTDEASMNLRDLQDSKEATEKDIQKAFNLPDYRLTLFRKSNILGIIEHFLPDQEKADLLIRETFKATKY